MIGRLTGLIARRRPGEVLLDVGGVGYRVSIPLSTFCALPAEHDSVSLEIHTLVRDNAILLYGFATDTEKTLFEALLSVSGVGPKVALAVLSGPPPEEIARAVLSGDALRLRSIPGVGRKLAERIVLELRDRLGRMQLAAGTAQPGPAGQDAKEAEFALLNLGYAASEARDALDRARSEATAPLSIEALLRETLRILAR